MKNQILNALKVSLLAIVLSFGMSYALAWTAPTTTPPAGNVSAPLNTSATAQTKAGTLAALNFITSSIQFLDGTTQTTASNHGKQMFTYLTPTGTWTAPAGVTKVWVSGSGGGGAGGMGNGSYAGGGGGGAVAVIAQVLTVTPNISYPITVGLGGNGGVYPAPNGGNSSFGTLMLLYGGNAGGGASASANGKGGAINYMWLGPGSDGNGIYGGAGGGGIFGAGAPGGASGSSGFRGGASGPGINGVGFGTGGSGAGAGGGTTSYSGGSGASGFILVEW